MKTILIITGLCLLFPFLLQAGEVDVLKVELEKTGVTYRFDVTLSHADEGWEHYANKWDVIGPDGTVYAIRTLYHPHVNEQPFTRSLSGVSIPDGIARVTVRGHDLVHGYGGREQDVDLLR